MDLIQDNVGQVSQECGPGSVIRQHRGMEHVWIGQNDRRVPPQPRPHGGGGVTVIDAEAQVGYAAAIDQTAQGPRLVLSQRLGGEQVQRPGEGLLDGGFQHRQVVAQGLAAGGAGGHQNVLATPGGLQRRGLVCVQPRDPRLPQRLGQRRGQRRRKVRVARLARSQALDVYHLFLVIGPFAQVGEKLPELHGARSSPTPRSLLCRARRGYLPV